MKTTPNQPMNRPDRRKVSNRVSFGKYIGKLWSEVPTEYLRWFSKRAFHQMKNRRLKAISELERRVT